MAEKLVNVILATTSRGEIGAKNTIPWKLKGDLKRFKELTMGNILIMGRNTYESLRSPLEGRTVIVVSQTLAKSTQAPQWPAYFVEHMLDAIALANTLDGDQIFIAGGTGIYQQALFRINQSFMNKLYMTVVHQEPSDVYDAIVPDFSMDRIRSRWHQEGSSHVVFMDDGAEPLVKSHEYLTFSFNQAVCR